MLKGWILLTCILVITLSLPQRVNAQDHSAEFSGEVGPSITLDIQNQPFRIVLERIEKFAGLNFSYSPRRIPLDQKISYKVDDKPLSDVLGELSALLELEFMILEKQIIIHKPPNVQSTADSRFTLSGHIREEDTGEILIGTNILVNGLNIGTTTNAYGFYSLTLPPGDYDVTYSYLGYKTKTVAIGLYKNLPVNIKMPSDPELLPELVVVSERIIPADRVQMSNAPLPPREAEEMPSFMAEPDVIKSIQSIPGIKGHSDGSTFFHVRGGNRDQNLILVDDAPIYNPSHLLGFFSTIIPEATKDVIIYKGDIPASMGGRLSSVIDVHTKDGNNNRFQAWGSLGLISSKLALEGPLKKQKSSYFLSGRLSRIRWIFRQSNSNLDKFHFYDLNGKVNFPIGLNNRIYASFYTGEDFYAEVNNGISWNNTSGTVRWNHLFSEKLFANTTLYSSKYDYFLHTNISQGIAWNSHIANVSLKSDFTYFKAPDNSIDFGVVISGHNFNPGNLESNDPNAVGTIVSRKNASEFNLYYSQKRELNEKWAVRYGIRFGSWSNLGDAFEFIFDQNGSPQDTLFFSDGEEYNNYTYLEPRFHISRFLRGKASLKFSYNRTVQNIHLISNSISPFTSLEVWLPSSINIKPQVADQVALGWKKTGNKGIDYSVEAYYKVLSRQIDYKDHAQMILNSTHENQLVFGKGRAYGLELSASKEEGRIRGRAGYTLSRVISRFEELNAGRWYPAYYDRPHEINIHTSYDLKPRINVGLGWNYWTGSAFSSPTGFYYYDGQEVPLFTEKNNSRFPDYHRLDVDVLFRLNKPGNKFEHSLAFSIFNFYGRRNTVFLNFNKTFDKNGNLVVPGDLFVANRVTTQTYLYDVTPSITYHFKL